MKHFLISMNKSFRWIENRVIVSYCHNWSCKILIVLCLQ